MTATAMIQRPARPQATRPRPAVRPSTAARPTAVVYRRRRLAALAVVLVLLTSVALLLTRVGQADADLNGRRSAPLVYVVQPGDTLWSIADAVAPGTDRREAVGALTDAAGGTELVPGQRLELPNGLR
jgi:nucleoid-associated protein YgaU